MIYSLRGTVLEVTPSFCAIEVNGIGYQIGISLQSYQKLHKDAQAFLFISQIIREDANLLFGFISKEERVLFNLLLSVSGVGPSSALIMLSSLSIEEIIEAISSGNSVLLQKVKGIGAKTAQRIVIDLRDKIQILGEVSFKDPLMGSSLDSVKQEAPRIFPAVLELWLTETQADHKVLRKNHFVLLIEQFPDPSSPLLPLLQ